MLIVLSAKMMVISPRMNLGHELGRVFHRQRIDSPRPPRR